MNFSASTAYNVGLQIINAANGDVNRELVIALFTQPNLGYNLAKNITTSEVPVNANTKYVRKPVSLTLHNQLEMEEYFSGDDYHGMPATVQNLKGPNGESANMLSGYAFIYNNAEVIWNDPPTVDWGTVHSFALINQHNVDPLLSEVLMWGNLETSKLVMAGDIFRFPIDGLRVLII